MRRRHDKDLHRSCDLALRLGDDEDEVSAHVTFDATATHCIRWDDPLTAVISRLPRWIKEWPAVKNDPVLSSTGRAMLCANGTVALTTFPFIRFPSGETRLPSPGELCVLVAIMLDMTCMRLPEKAGDLRRDTNRNPKCADDKDHELEYVMEVPDVTGERPVHALLLASARRGTGTVALQLAYTMFTMHHKLLTYAHLPGTEATLPDQIFDGENCFHIAAVNRAERLLLAMINLASRLNAKGRALAFGSKCEGLFFTQPPQAWYGGTVLSFAAVFGLKRAVKVLCTTQARYTGGLNTLGNSQQQATLDDDLHHVLAPHHCHFTGFLTLHAVVASCAASTSRLRPR